MSIRIKIGCIKSAPEYRETCDVCGLERETLEHFLWECNAYTDNLGIRVRVENVVQTYVDGFMDTDIICSTILSYERTKAERELVNIWIKQRWQQRENR